MSKTHELGAESPVRIIPLWDALGMMVSILCLIHCLFLPLVIGFLPLLGMEFLVGHGTHQILAAMVVLFCLLAVVPGYLQHRNPKVIILMSAGLLLVLVATFGVSMLFQDRWEVPLISCGNLMVVAAHLRNRQLAGTCNHNHT